MIDHDHGDVSTKEEISRVLRKAYRGIDAMRTYAWTNAVIALLVGLVADEALSIAGWACAAIAAMVALIIRKRPFLGATLLAAMITAFFLAVVVLFVNEGESLLNKEIMIAAVWTGGCWWAANHMRHAERLMREHPDLFAAKLLRGKAPKRDPAKRRRRV